MIIKENQIEFTKYISPDGEIYNFDNQFNKFLLSGIGNMGMPDINYRTERGPFQDGSTPLGFVLEPRVVTMSHRFNGGCRQEYWDNRAEMLNALRPNRQAIGEFETGELVKVLPDGTERRLLVLVQEGPRFPGIVRGRWDEFSAQDVINFIAHDPIFYDPNQCQQELTFASGQDELDFPIEFSIQFSSDGSVPTDTITYLGTYKSFPTILMVGPLTDPIVNNITTQEKIKYEGTIAAGRTVVINLEFGNKTITDDLGNNLIGNLSTDSDLANFHLEPHPGAEDGVNQIGVAANATTANSRIAMSWFSRYIGI
jgi:hypothetical protein